MRALSILPLALTLILGACAREEGADEPVEAAPAEAIMVVADSTIERDAQARLESDPRLDGEGIDITVHSDGQDVTLVGSVPTRYEMSVAREVVQSTPGVRQVYLDSLRVESEAQTEAAPVRQDAAAPRT